MSNDSSSLRSPRRSSLQEEQSEWSPTPDDLREDEPIGRRLTMRPTRTTTITTWRSKRDKKLSFFRRTWKKLDLDVNTLCLMIKGAIPPTVGLAMYQSNSFSDHYGNLGYLVAISAMLTQCILPRAKFVQTVCLNIIGICIATCFVVLMLYTSIKAREHTVHTRAGLISGTYNPSASAVVGVWLFCNIYAVNTLRAYRPQFTIPCILYNIFICVGATYGTQFARFPQCTAFAKQLLEAFLTGFALATITSLFIFPRTSRHNVFNALRKYTEQLKDALGHQVDYMKTLESLETLEPNCKDAEEVASQTSAGFAAEDHIDSASERRKMVENMKSMSNDLALTLGQFRAELGFAKREIAIGKLSGKDLYELKRLIQNIHVPVIGMLTVSDLVERISKDAGWQKSEDPEDVQFELSRITTQGAIKRRKNWTDIMQMMQEPFVILTEAMMEGLDHVMWTLQLTKPPKNNNRSHVHDDPESRGGDPLPGEDGFATYFDAKLDEYIAVRGEHMRDWATQLNIDYNGCKTSKDYMEHKRHQRQLFLVLHVEYLYFAASKGILELVRFANLKVADGTMKKRRLIFPNKRRILKWFKSLGQVWESNADHNADMQDSGETVVYLGDALKKRKDPEHLPPTNHYQTLTDKIRTISHFFASPESAFGFRVACAVMTLAIVLLLRNSQRFFIEQRLFWSMIMVAISMNNTAGSGIFGFVLRILGTLLATVACFAIWYIPDGHTAGVLVFFCLWIVVMHYFLVRHQPFTVGTMISMVTTILIVGYELQVRKVGVAFALTSGQLYYPVYELAPYRLATVAGGIFVAFIWTFFPYPVTARSALRKGLGSSLYLLANYFSCLRTTLNMRLAGREGDMALKSSPGRKLEKARDEIFAKELALISNLRIHLQFTNYEPTFGGRFPRKAYTEIIDTATNMLRYLSLISYSTQSFHHSRPSSNSRMTPHSKSLPCNSPNWLPSLLSLLASVSEKSHMTTSVLTLLSSALTSALPLPPYLRLSLPPSFSLVEELENLDPDILGQEHIREPGYTAFAVLQIVMKICDDDLRRLVEEVRGLVGEVDFEFKIRVGADGSKGSGTLVGGWGSVAPSEWGEQGDDDDERNQKQRSKGKED